MQFPCLISVEMNVSNSTPQVFFDMEKCNIELQKKDPKKDTLPETEAKRSESESGNKVGRL